MSIKQHRLACLALFGCLLGSWQAGQAQESQRGWDFAVAPYLWLSGLEGDIGTLPSVPPVSVDSSFGDIFDVLNMAFMIAGEARRGLFAGLADLQYYDLEPDAATPGPLFSSAAVRSKLWIASLGLGYRLAESQNGNFDVMAAMRYWSLDSTLTLREGLLPAQSFSDSESWYDPMFGVRGRSTFGQRWHFNGWALFGLGGDSDSAWDVYGGVIYDFNSRWQGRIGYRHMAVDFREGAFLYDVEQSGPMLGVSYTF